MNEVSGYIARVAQQLRTDYPQWDVEPLNISAGDEPTGHLYIRVAVTSMEALPSLNRGRGGVYTRVETVARVVWRAQDPTTQQLAQPTDVAATLHAWSNLRGIDGSTLLEPGRVDRVLEPDTYASPDPTRVVFLVTWYANIWVEPSIDGQTPAEPTPLEGYPVGDLKQVTLGDEVVFP